MGTQQKLDKATVLYGKGNFLEAATICRKILDKKPKLFDAKQLLAMSVHAQGHAKEAQELFSQALTLNNNHAATHNNLGNVYVELKNITMAIKAYQRSLSINPKQADALNNLANCLQLQNQFQKAKEAYLKAIAIDPNKPEYHDNLGVVETRQGNFDEAAKCFLKALEINPKMGKVYIHFFDLLMFMHAYTDALELSNIAMNSQCLHDPEICELLIGQAKIHWMQNNMTQLKQCLDLSHSIRFNYTNYPNLNNLIVYHQFLELLHSSHSQSPNFFTNEAMPEIYFMSESHCFSSSNLILENAAGRKKISPIFITGCKIFHLVQETANQYQKSFVLGINQLPKAATVILGFGEIDCRYDEGIFPHCEKNNIAVTDNIDELLTAYIDLMTSQANANQLSLIIYGVPMPHRKVIEKIPELKREPYINMISYFNQKLMKLCKIHSHKFLDIYALTKADQNNHWHMDEIHVKPEAILNLLSDKI
ncbi:tetratricopeptide repeat protein [Aliikangiella sp. IMCC44632]